MKALIVAMLMLGTARTALGAENTTDISPSLYKPHRRSNKEGPALAHCRQINVFVNGRMQSRRQCVTPAE